DFHQKVKERRNEVQNENQVKLAFSTRWFVSLDWCCIAVGLTKCHSLWWRFMGCIVWLWRFSFRPLSHTKSYSLVGDHTRSDLDWVIRHYYCFIFISEFRRRDWRFYPLL